MHTAEPAPSAPPRPASPRPRPPAGPSDAVWRRLDWSNVNRHGEVPAPDVRETSRWLRRALLYHLMRGSVGPVR